MISMGALLTLASQNYSAIIKPLQWIVIGLVFLFFLWIVRAVLVEVRPAGPRLRDAAAPQLQGRSRRELHLEIVRPEENLGQRFDVASELTIGRAPGSGLSTAGDAYTSVQHARIYRRDNHLYVEDLGSTNGTFVNSERLTRVTKLTKGDLVQIGETVLEVTR